MRFLGRKICGRIFFVSADFGVGLYLQVGLAGFFVHAVGVEPEHALDGVGLVFQRKTDRSHGIEPVFPMSVVKLAAAQPHGDVGQAFMAGKCADQRPMAGHDERRIFFGRLIADKVRRRISFAQRRHGPIKFLLHDGEQDRIRIGSGSLLAPNGWYKRCCKKRP